MNIAIIPARGGSKRIPKKNIKMFAGKPMIAYPIELAIRSKLFDHVVVTTECDEIAEIAKSYGAELPFRRPAELANDTAVGDSVLVHAIETLQGMGWDFEYFCCIFATTPFLTMANLVDGFDAIKRTDAITTIAVTQYAHPIQRALRIDTDDGTLSMIRPEYRHARSQEMETTYHDLGQFSWVHTARYMQERYLFSSRTAPVVLPPGQVVDIDTPEDWAIAERIYTLTAESRDEA